MIIFSFYPSVVKAFRELNANIQTLFLITQKNKNTIQTAVDLGVNAIGLGPLNKISKKYLKKLIMPSWKYGNGQLIIQRKCKN